MGIIEKAVGTALVVGIGAAVSNFIKRHQTDEAPPPEEPESPALNDLYIPYALAEQTRIFLHLLAKSRNKHLVPDALRESITAWLNEHDTQLLSWLASNYGPGVLMYADRITKSVFDHQAQVTGVSYSRAESDLLSRLEDEFEEDGDAQPNSAATGS